MKTIYYNKCYLIWLLLVFSAMSFCENKQINSTYLTKIVIGKCYYDGYINRFIIKDDNIILGWKGTKMACYDGGVFKSSIEKPDLITKVFQLGMNSILSRNGEYNESPYLVDVVGNKTYIVNLICGSKFPNSTKESKLKGATRNIILYYEDKKLFKNITELDKQSQQGIEGMRWFPKEGILLCKEYKIKSNYDRPWPITGTTKPVCIKLPENRRLSIESYPGIKRWYLSYSSIIIERDIEKEETGEKKTWTINTKNHKNKIVFKAENKYKDSRTNIFLVSPNLLCLGDKNLGTYLVDFENTIRVKISNDPLIDYSYESQKIILKSDKRCANDQRLFWVFDLKIYFNYIQSRVSQGRLLKKEQ